MRSWTTSFFFGLRLYTVKSGRGQSFCEGSKGGIMIRRLNTWKIFKSGLLSVICFALFYMFDGLNIMLDTWNQFQHHVHLHSFTSHIIILNSSPSATNHLRVYPYPHPYRFLINQPRKCLTRNPFLLLLVIGESQDVKARDTIRMTWGNVSNYRDVDVMMLFLVGISPVMTGAIQRLLEEESTIYEDIVQQDFLDTYQNLTLKTLMGMEWVTDFCPNASYVMKVDNDVFLNVNYLVHQLLHPDLSPRTNYVTGYILCHTGPVRDKESQWYISEEVYPGDTYPPYPLGAAYVFSGDMAQKIYKVAQEIRVFGIEDAFIGICLYKLNILPTNTPRNMFNGRKIDFHPYTFCNLVMVHNYKDNDLKKVWQQLWRKGVFVC
ncbi:beta-1,3-galactosyltransferase 2-like [Bufo bufo]|uniref:beta-1,3-galactosyltransferase 2-like n=1 Tax=Bufo bufo TaxID=8384 RepID=UPI001ABE22D3|nr:beta-1,3-galactosyltransferase 2-like [Bufo bufo]